MTGGSGFLGQGSPRPLEMTFVSSHLLGMIWISPRGAHGLTCWLNRRMSPASSILPTPRIYTSNVAMGQTLTMLRNVIDVCTNRDIRLIYPSSWEIYSGYSGTLRAAELTPPMPRGPYGETKYLAEFLIEHCIRTVGCDAHCFAPALYMDSEVIGRSLSGTSLNRRSGLSRSSPIVIGMVSLLWICCMSMTSSRR